MLFKRVDNAAHSAVFEDDGKVAYAYLLYEGSIVSEVWLYNRISTPEQPEWRDRSRVPFANSLGFATSDPFPPVSTEEEVVFEWSRDAAGYILLKVFIRGTYHAALTPGRKPGWCRLAVKDGPLASVLRP